jgi:hypothetical protein
MTDITWPTPFGYVIFCDDVRSEVDGKTTIVGAYGSDIVFGVPLPVTVGKFALVIKYFEMPGESNEPVKIEVHFPWDVEGMPAVAVDLPVEEIRKMLMPEGIDVEDARIGISFNFIFPPITFVKEGYILVRAIRGGDVIRLGRLRVAAAAPAAG